MGIQLTINGEGMVVDKSITLAQAGKIITFLGSELETTTPATHLANGVMLESAAASMATPTSMARQSLRELMDAAGAKTHAHRITVLGGYIASTNNDEEFTVAEVKQLYPQAREKIPPNFTRELDSAITAGYIEGVPGKKDTYFITRTGEGYLSSGFGSVIRKPKAKNSTTKSANVNAESVSESVRDLHPVTPDLSGYPSYHSVKTKGAKVLWILAYAQTHKIDQLSPREISYIANKLRDKIEARDMNGLTVTASRNGWIAKDNSANYSLLYKGDQHLKESLVVDGTD